MCEVDTVTEPEDSSGVDVVVGGLEKGHCSAQDTLGNTEIGSEASNHWAAILS